MLWRLKRRSLQRKRTAEGYKVYGGTAVDEWGDPVYTYNSIEDTHPFSDGFESTPD